MAQCVPVNAALCTVQAHEQSHACLVSFVISESSALRSRLNSSHEVRFSGTSSTAHGAVAAQLCDRSAGLGGIAARFHQKRFLSKYTRLLEIPGPAFVYWAVKKLNEKSF